MLTCMAYLLLSGREGSIIKYAKRRGDDPPKAAMGSQSLVQIGLLMSLPMVMEIGLERGFVSEQHYNHAASACSRLFYFLLGTKLHYF